MFWKVPLKREGVSKVFFNHKVLKVFTKYTKLKACISALCDLSVNLCALCGY
jgi:hypothetical protein